MLSITRSGNVDKPGVECGVDGLVKLQQDLQRKRGRQKLQLHQLVEGLLECVAERRVPVQLVGHHCAPPLSARTK